MNNHNIISIDLAKNVFQVCLMNQHQKIVLNKKVARAKLYQTVIQLDAKHIVMEACYSSNHWARLFLKDGYDVHLIPPHQVKPFVTGNKNDHNDAIAIAEASLRPKATRVAVKSFEQQDIQSLYRIRERLVRHRTAVINQLRGLLAEYGIVINKKHGGLRSAIPDVLENPNNDLTVSSREFIYDLYLELLDLDKRVEKKQQLATALLKNNKSYQHLQSVPGIGPIIAGHLIASVGDAQQFKNGRQMAAWMGLTPKQHASGNHSRMGGISKRGNVNMRKHLIHGARTVLNWCANKDDALSLWLNKLLTKKHPCVVIVALANKMARIAWAILTKQENYNVQKLLPANA
ncbi:UNVERIFIED_CONTAM: hypothetical protein GTU68_063724 [Idotea baltica]|nr:hypothetical protein [Idotea baltica]